MFSLPACFLKHLFKNTFKWNVFVSADCINYGFANTASPRGLPQPGAGTPGPGQRPAAWLGPCAALRAWHRAPVAGPRREVAAKKANPAAVSAVTPALGAPCPGGSGPGAQDAESPGPSDVCPLGRGESSLHLSRLLSSRPPGGSGQTCGAQEPAPSSAPRPPGESRGVRIARRPGQSRPRTVHRAAPCFPDLVFRALPCPS